jgi:hypothetical protein
MSPEKQRIAIAEACGWTDIRMSGPWECTDPGQLREDLCGMQRQHPWREIVPDYLSDLNAMHAAEKVLPVEEQGQYICWINDIVKAQPWSERDGISYEDAWLEVHATAAQRAEAFLRTIGKWEDA